jgi:hypothetical protein
VGGASAAAEALDLRVAPDGTVSIPKLTSHPVTSASAVDNLLAEAAKRRHTHATLMNAESSRSHLVLTVHVTMRNARDGVERYGKLHLVDLAGSERVGKSGVVGEQMKEAQHINKSLSSLEQVSCRRGALHTCHTQWMHSPTPCRHARCRLSGDARAAGTRWQWWE